MYKSHIARYFTHSSIFMAKRKIPLEIMFLLGLKKIHEIFVDTVTFSAFLLEIIYLST